MGVLSTEPGTRHADAVVRVVSRGGDNDDKEVAVEEETRDFTKGAELAQSHAAGKGQQLEFQSQSESSDLALTSG